jgi:hypothetical protein
MPGVRSVALASTVPMRTDNLQVSQVAPEGFTFAPGIESAICPSVLVDEGYFDTTGIRIVEGRGFLATDNKDSPQVAIVNQRFVARYWPGQSAIGKRVNIRDAKPRTIEIVGVAADSRYFFIVEPQLEFMYWSGRRSRRTDACAGPLDRSADADPRPAHDGGLLRRPSHSHHPVDRWHCCRAGWNRRAAGRGGPVRAGRSASGSPSVPLRAQSCEWCSGAA